MTKTELKEELRKIISEVLNEDYIPSTDPENILFDFYVLSYISSINLDVTSKGYGGGFIGKDPEELKSLITAAENKLLPYLQKEMLDAVFYSLGCEIRYAIDVERYYTSNILGRESWVENPMMYKYLHRLTQTFQSSGDLPSRNISHALIKTITGDSLANKSIFVTGAKKAFGEFEWEDGYGGDAWARICDGWLRLNRATTRAELYVAIDHIYDLQHNNGSVFNKVHKYSKDGITWLTKALNLKAKIKNIHTILPMCSSDMRKIALMVLKRANISKPAEDVDISKGTKKTGTKLTKMEELKKFLDLMDKTRKEWQGYKLTDTTGVYKDGVYRLTIYDLHASPTGGVLPRPIEVTVTSFNDTYPNNDDSKPNKYETVFNDFNNSQEEPIETVFHSLKKVELDLKNWFNIIKSKYLNKGKS